MPKNQVWFSETRACMAMLMGATMAVVMLVHSQAAVDQVSWMKAMIPPS
jgi:hypothetical protein